MIDNKDLEYKKKIIKKRRFTKHTRQLEATGITNGIK